MLSAAFANTGWYSVTCGVLTMAEWRVPTKLRSCLASTSAYNTLSANRLPEARMNLALARVFTAVLLLCVLKNTTARFYGPLDGHFPAPPAFCLHVVQQYYCTTVFLFSHFFFLSHGGKVLLKWHSQSNRDQLYMLSSSLSEPWEIRSTYFRMYFKQ